MRAGERGNATRSATGRHGAGQRGDCAQGSKQRLGIRRDALLSLWRHETLATRHTGSMARDRQP